MLNILLIPLNNEHYIICIELDVGHNNPLVIDMFCETSVLRSIHRSGELIEMHYADLQHAQTCLILCHESQ